MTHATCTHTESAPQEQGVRPIPSPAQLKMMLPLPPELAVQVEQHRQAIRKILNGESDKLLIITGPCSLHDADAALDYAQRLVTLNQTLSDKLLIVMRAYVEKPRTTVGWKGLAYDPDRTGKGDMQKGLRQSRRLMQQILAMGLPLATEALNPLVALYLDDLVSWTAIGARTTESQTHREMVSRLPMPVGLKNGTDGSVQVAINAMKSAKASHHTLGLDCDGNIAILDTPGNADTHVVLRGGRGITNYDADSIQSVQSELDNAGCSRKVLVDCSHDNACKQHERQMPIAIDVVKQRAAGNRDIIGLMLESNIKAGNQPMSDQLQYGVSITDPCIDWDATRQLLEDIHLLLSC